MQNKTTQVVNEEQIEYHLKVSVCSMSNMEDNDTQAVQWLQTSSKKNIEKALWNGNQDNQE